MGNTVDAQGSQGQTGAGQQVSVSATTIGAAAAAHTQAALSIQPPPVSICRKVSFVL